MVVQDDGVVVPKPVETGPLEDHAMRVITHGLLRPIGSSSRG
jgi:hypothetical protein